MVRRGLIAITMLAVVGAAAANPLRVSVPPNRDPQPLARAAPSADVLAARAALDLMTCLSAIAQGRLADGEEACSDAIRLNPGDVTAFKLRGYGYLLGHDYERAGDDLRTALQMDPNDDEILAGYAESLSGRGKFSQSLPFFRKALLLAPGNATYWSAECWARAGTGKQLGIALEHCDRALALAPGAAGPLNSRGLVHLRMGLNAAALQDYDRSLKARATVASARFGRGIAQLRLGNGEAALADITAARATDAAIDSMFVTLGVLPKPCRDASGKPGCPPPLQRKAPYPWQSVHFVTDPDDDFLMTIEVGRLEVMVQQIAFLLHDPERKPGELDTALPTRLAAAMARFSLLLPQACETGHVPSVYCAPYHQHAIQPWQLGAAVDSAFGRIYPVWKAICQGHQAHCVME